MKAVMRGKGFTPGEIQHEVFKETPQYYFCDQFKDTNNT